MRFLFLFLLSFLFLPLGAEAAALGKPPNNLGLVAYWSFNEGTSTQATDFSGNLFAGTLSGFAAPPTAASGWTSSGRRGGALQFDGTNDYVLTSDLGNRVDGIARLSFAFWIKSDSIPDTQVLISKNNGTNGWELNTGETGFTGGGNDLLFQPGGGLFPCYTDVNAHAAGVWEHWVVTFDGTAGPNASDQVKFYKNGQQVATTCIEDTDLWTVVDANSATVAIGQEQNLGSTYHDGTMDEVRIYARTLSATEAAYLAGQAPGGAGAVRIGASSKTLTDGTTLEAANGLVALWTFDGGDTNWTSQTTGFTYDGSGNNTAGTLTNMNRSSSPTLGKLGQAIRFDGVDDEMSFSGSLGTTHTIAMWIYPTSASVSGCAVSACVLLAERLTRGIFWTPGQSVAYLAIDVEAATSAIPLNTWTHITAVSNAGNVQLYVNGVADGTGSGLTAYNPNVVGGDAVNTQPFPGSIDDVRMYSRALSTSEVQQLYRLGQATIIP